VRLHLGRALALLDRPEEAAFVLEALRGSGDAELVMAADTCLQLARHRGALAEFEAAERALASGEARSARRIVRRLVRSVPRSPEVWRVLGIAHSRLGHLRRGVAALRRALTLAPAMLVARSELGIALIGLGRFDEAYRHLKIVAETAPGGPGPMAHLAQACYYLKRFAEGEEWLRRAEALAPAHPTLESVRSTFYPTSR
jgi:Flp pilus assembly protein TadD